MVSQGGMERCGPGNAGKGQVDTMGWGEPSGFLVEGGVGSGGRAPSSRDHRLLMGNRAAVLCRTRATACLSVAPTRRRRASVLRRRADSVPTTRRRCASGLRRRADGVPTVLRRRADGVPQGCDDAPTVLRRRADGVTTTRRQCYDDAPTVCLRVATTRRQCYDDAPTVLRRRADSVPTTRGRCASGLRRRADGVPRSCEFPANFLRIPANPCESLRIPANPCEVLSACCRCSGKVLGGSGLPEHDPKTS